MLEIKDLRIQYGKKTVIEGFDLKVYPGEIVGVLGKNGAGKTTLLKAIAGLKTYSAGTVKLDTDRGLGYVPEVPQLYDYLTSDELLTALSKLKNVSMDEFKSLTEWLGIYMELPDLNTLICKLSKGNQEKITFLQALLGEPDLLVLDEPFTGLDARSFLGAKQLLKDYAKKGKMVLISTHVVDLCAGLCHRMILLNGRNQFCEICPEEGLTLEERIALITEALL